MDIGALLQAFIYLISSSLLYPVLFMLVFLTLLIILYAGSFFAEWIEISRLEKYLPQKLPGLIRSGEFSKYVSHRVKEYIRSLKEIINRNEEVELSVENLLQETTVRIWKSMDKYRIMVRVGPALGLLGTLIPMGTGLAALGQGDMTKLSSDLVIAFTTTVVGLGIGTLAFFIYTVKRRWLEIDIKNMELATEIMMSSNGEDK
ncbi:MAG: MotA/TolQ/ExbB proton channel family protein [Deltaproteobacteria bacterium]|nr:MotA/TolQ/ExbB proton channel family protein [Deltaproteobacteria bacterium]